MEEYEHVTENKVNTKNHILRALFLFMKLVIDVGLFKKTLCGLLVWIKTHIKYGHIISLNTMLFLFYKNYSSDFHIEIITQICILIIIFSTRVMNNKIAKYAYCHL